MRLAWIEIRDFRNHADTALEVPPGLIVAVGPNAQGKTNLLEAMFYLCALDSPRVSSDLPLVRAGAASAFLRGEVHTRAGRFCNRSAGLSALEEAHKAGRVWGIFSVGATI